MMMDPAILMAMDLPPPPWRPQIVEERPWRSRPAESAERIARKYGDAYARYADEWVSRVNRTKAELETMPVERGTHEELAQLMRTIEEFESTAEQRALEGARLAKRGQARVRRLFRTDPSLAAVERAFLDRLFAIDERIIGAMLDYALFLRACFAEANPAAHGGPIFDDPAALERHLNALVGA
jgi:hypothetical protein